MNDVPDDHRPAAQDNSSIGSPAAGFHRAKLRSVLRREKASAALIGMIMRMWLYSGLFRARSTVVREGFHQMAKEAAQRLRNAKLLVELIL